MTFLYNGIFCGSKYKLFESSILAFDLDGTIAKNLHPFDPTKIGPPVPRMIKKIIKLLKAGEKVVILTARMNSTVHTPEQRKFTKHLIEAYCKKYIGQKLPVTAEKHYAMKRIYDDRARQVKENKGIIVG